MHLERLFNEETISNTINTKWTGRPVHFANEVDSTNLWIKRLAAAGASHGTLAVAEYQSAGRGRLGRSWVAPAGSCITMSLLLYPDLEPQYASMLTLVMGLSVAQTVADLGVEVSIKWPNDVVVSRKKICGILTEMELEQGRIRHVVVGTGINVNLEEIPEDLKESATSLYLETGRYFDRNAVIAGAMEHFEQNYEQFMKTKDLQLLKEDYENLLANLGQPVRVLSKDPFEGVALGINVRGELLVRKEDNSVTAVNSGEVSVRGLYSYV
jgi:BirA family biotin operon repressor/biotin-[acetyl-CoA-carboxylase] ligase